MSRARRGPVESNDWVATDRPIAAEFGEDPELQSTLRLYFHAVGRLEPTGHAHFARGELAELMSVVDKSTGELTPMKTPTLSRNIKALVGRGLFGADSWARCLRLPPSSGVQNSRRSVPHTPCPPRPQGRTENLK